MRLIARSMARRATDRASTPAPLSMIRGVVATSFVVGWPCPGMAESEESVAHGADSREGWTRAGSAVCGGIGRGGSGAGRAGCGRGRDA